MRRRTMLWSVPAITVAAAAPAYATSEECKKKCAPSPHKCDKACNPKVSCERKKKDGKWRWYYSAKSSCPLVKINKSSWYEMKRHDAVTVVWQRNYKTHVTLHIPTYR